MRDLGRVNVEDIKSAAKQFLPEFLSSDTSQTVIVCNPASVEEIVKDFSSFGIELTSYDRLEDTFLVN